MRQAANRYVIGFITVLLDTTGSPGLTRGRRRPAQLLPQNSRFRGTAYKMFGSGYDIGPAPWLVFFRGAVLDHDPDVPADPVKLADASKVRLRE
ncbi:hypothetical protein PG995_008840 [Apiospora arundinis]|uniref:Uncharacterized protein n=1 Tax=Apiospora arundinis TaxID=335852 RepID=A0ABR2JMU1_9PEZI